MKNACKVLAGLATLVLTLISIWATINPITAYAASATANCGNYSVSCSGERCISADSGPGARGYCYCSRTDGTTDLKFCSGGVAQSSFPGTN